MLVSVLLLVPQGGATAPRDSADSVNTEAPQTEMSAEPWYKSTAVLIPAFASVIAALLGGFAGGGISIWFTQRQARGEYRALILAFCSELVGTFNRCVSYYEQAKKSEFSYSALFSFTDASALSKLASVSQNPEIIASIIELKARYFQIQRHVDEAQNFAVEASRATHQQEQQQLWLKAHRARGTALGFFFGNYEDIEKETSRIVTATKHAAPGEVADGLALRFSEAQARKANLDAEKENNQ